MPFKWAIYFPVELAAMKLVLVRELLSLPFIVRYCAAVAASDSSPNRLLPDSETTSTSPISLPEGKISKANPISTITTTEASNFQQWRENSPPSTDHPPFDIGGEESSELHSQQGKDDPCLSDEKNQAPSRRRRLRRQACLAPPFSSPYGARKNPVTLPPIPAWGDTDLNIPIKLAPPAAGVTENPELCADDWQNMPVCAPEDSAIGGYLPSCRPRTFEKKNPVFGALAL